MTYIDTRSYDQYEMWQRKKKAPQWLAGYKEGFSGSPLPSTVSAHYMDGYGSGSRDREKENNPPFIKGGFGYGHGFRSEAWD